MGSATRHRSADADANVPPPFKWGGFGPCLEGLEMGLSGFAGVWVGLTICRRGLGWVWAMFSKARAARSEDP